MRFHWRVLGVALGAMMIFCGVVSSAWAAVNPGWECVPTTAGKAVTSGGTGSAPSCASGNTAVLAPTYVSSGTGGQPTVRFTAVNVQVVSGSGSTAGAVNGRGNLVIGYDEAPNSQSGSHNLVLGSHQAYTSYGSIVAGSHNFANGQYSAVLGEGNSATGAYATVTGGIFNHAADRLSAISGGCKNVTGSGGVGNFCSGPGLESVSGGYSNVAAGPISSISGGYANQANGSRSSVAGGEFNIAGDQFSFIGAGCDNLTGPGSNIIVGCDPGAEAILGGFAQHVTTQDGTYPAGP